jgi:dTMP kinase
MRGKFITFEGGEGAGKTTQIKLLAKALEDAGKKILILREPGGTRLSELIRPLLKDETVDPPCDKAELLLFLAARAQLVEKAILPALEEGTWVLCDRFSDSTFAYQGYGRGLPLDVIRLINGFACSDLKPDATILLDLDPEKSRSRVISRAGVADAGDRIEKAGNDFHRRLRDGFLELAKQDENRFVILDASGEISEIQEKIWKSIAHMI